jgi:hypothetical protein
VSLQTFIQFFGGSFLIGVVHA